MKIKVVKFNFAQLLMVVFLFVSFIACDRDEALQEVAFFDYEQIGVIHNRGIDYVFNYVKEKTVHCKPEMKTGEALLHLVEEGTREFLKKSDLFDEPGMEIALEESKKPFIFYNDCLKDNLKSSTMTSVCLSEIEALLTHNQKAILIEMDEVFNGNIWDVQEVTSSLEALEKKIISECSEEEKHILLCATSIGRHSFQYWSNNFDLWFDEFGPDIKFKKAQFNWAEVGKNDVAYGIGGGISGAVIGGSVTLGVLAIPGWAVGAIGGAISGSAGNAILQVW